jgi:hypothetical protein
MNYCNFCGNPVKGNEKFCTSCGAAIAPSPNQMNQQQPAQQNQQVGFNGQPVNNNVQTGKTTGTAIGGFVCSMVGLIILPFIMGILGLSLSVSGLNHIKTFPQDKGKGLAIAGIVIGIIDIAWAILVGVLSTMK